MKEKSYFTGRAGKARALDVYWHIYKLLAPTETRAAGNAWRLSFIDIFINLLVPGRGEELGGKRNASPVLRELVGLSKKIGIGSPS